MTFDHDPFPSSKTAARAAGVTGEAAVVAAKVLPPEGLEVSKRALALHLKGQLRLAIAAAGGALVLRHVLPAWLVNEQTVDYVLGLLLLGGAAVWQYVRTKVVNSRWWVLAKSPKVPDTLVRPASEA